MPKPKKARIPNHPPRSGDGGNVSQSNKKGRKMRTFPKLSTSTGNTSNPSANDKEGKKKKQQNQQHQRPIIPFGRKDRILLIGEGDFSFARSLVVQHRCRHVLATCYDSEDALRDKYSQVQTHLPDILGAVSDKKRGLHAPSSSASNVRNGQEEDGKEECRNGGGKSKGTDADADSQNASVIDDPKHKHSGSGSGPEVLFSVDARKLGSAAGGGKDVRNGYPRREPKRPAWCSNKSSSSSSKSSGGPWDLICFNFPHVGGLSTDVNRQVRANQELLVAFFKAAVPLLSTPPDIDEDEDDWEFSSSEGDSETDNDDDDDEEEGSHYGNVTNATEHGKSKWRTEPGQILVTLFEGEPYTLWNIRDLARHAGLRVVTSFKFPWASYQNYAHARTLGEIEGKNGGKGGWRGEDREARTYVFEVKREENGSARNTGKAKSSKADANSRKKKRSRDESGSDSD